MNKSRRKVFKVTSSLQYRFLAMSLIYSFVIVCFFASAVFVPDINTMSDESISLEIRSAAANRVLTKHSWVWPALFSLIALLGIHSFREFQKVAGPLYRFRWVFGELAKGNMVFPVKIRKKDYLREDEEALNKMLASLVERLGNINQAIEKAFKSIDELEQSLDMGSEKSAAQIALLRTHREHLDKLSTVVRFFRLKDEGQKTAGSEHDAREREGDFFEEKGHGRSRFETGV
jgi:methyl-accepting chemotaxis protein